MAAQTRPLLFAVLLALAPPALAGPARSLVALPPGAVVDTGAIYPDRRLAAYVQEVGVRLALRAGVGPGWRFVLLDDATPNAFALPDRRVAVTRGMLALAGDEAELAAVIAHELGHAVAGDAGRPPADPAAAERRADRIGIGILAAAGYDPAAQGDLQQSLIAAHALDARLRGGIAAPLPAQSYAPGLADRLAASRAMAAGRGGTRNRSGYLAAIDGMAWGRRGAGLHIRIHRIARGEDVVALASSMPVGNGSRPRFDLINGLHPGDGLKVGATVKLIGR